MFAHNLQKFQEMKKLNLPAGQYAITGSGPMGVRGLRKINDVDIIVSSELWTELAKKHDIIDANGVKKIVIAGELVEAFGEDSFYAATKDLDAPSLEVRISQAEIIDGLPFEALEHVIYYKKKMGRDKDLKDIAIIEAWREAQKNKDLRLGL